MKAREIKKCALCGKGVMHAGLPLFYRVKIQRFGIDLRAVQRQQGLELMLGSPALAEVMGPQEEMTMDLTAELTRIVCERCSTELHALAALAEHRDGDPELKEQEEQE